MNTNPTKKRTITLKIELVSDDARRTIGVKFDTDSKLVALNPVTTALYIGADPDTGEVGAVEMTAQIPGQKNLINDEEQPPRKTISISPKQALAN